MRNPFIEARHDELEDLQDRNRSWWEELPMTYRDWHESDRRTTIAELECEFLKSNPFLEREFFTKFRGKDVLEVGCGAGVASYLFAKNGARVTAIDITEKSS
jgi:2-polyprenyl-3-methyl-5-hydroxy-6-metoxy-1,4-benzoquinol methylase